MAATHIDINTASEEELAQFPAIGEDRAHILVMERPFHDWNEIDDLPGFSPTLVDEIQQEGAYLGGQAEETGVNLVEEFEEQEDAW